MYCYVIGPRSFYMKNTHFGKGEFYFEMVNYWKLLEKNISVMLLADNSMQYLQSTS